MTQTEYQALSELAESCADHRMARKAKIVLLAHPHEHQKWVTMTISERSKQVLCGHYKWILLGLLFVSGFLNLEDRVVIFSIIPLMRRELHLTDMQTGALMTTFLWTYAACSPFFLNQQKITSR